VALAFDVSDEIVAARLFWEGLVVLGAEIGRVPWQAGVLGVIDVIMNLPGLKPGEVH